MSKHLDILKKEGLVIASHNQGKIKEIKNLLEPHHIHIQSSSDLGLDEPIEDGEAFKDNALIKAKAVADQSQKPALADDSGLVIPALGGEPGVYSARWAGEHKDFKLAMQKVWDRISEKNLQNVKAYFETCLCFISSDNKPHFFLGRVNGFITWPPTGDQGFGYDPIFKPENFDQTFAQMTLKEKQQLSHRGNALRQFLDAIVIKGEA